MRKEAIGIAINGREVKIAHVFRDKYRLGVDFLESAVFTTDIDAELKKKEEQPSDAAMINDDEDLFTTKSPYASKSPLEKETGIRENIDILYSLLAKFAANKIKVAFNISPARVTYQDLDTHLDYNKNVFKSSLKQKIESWKKGFNALENVSVFTRADGTLCNVFCETYQPPVMEILEHLNSYFKGNLFLALMDSNEVALVNLARAGYDFHDPSKITAIVQIETEFSRIIFMRGGDILTVSPVVNESFNPEIINIVYSKIIYELDNLNISDITNILLAGRASSATAKSFFEKKFPDAKVGFIIAQPLAENLSSQYNREDLSSFAIPISLAWKAIESDNKNFIPTNLLPTQFIDRQKVLTLSFAGYLLLILLGITAFIMTWKITAKKIELGELRREAISLQQQINNSESTVNRVYEIEAEISRIKKRFIMSDSLSSGSDRLLTFLEKLNQSVLKINTVWIEEIKNSQNGILIKGVSLKRGDVPRISEELGGAKITKLVRSGSGGGRNFTFEMEVNWLPAPSKFTLPKSFELEKPLLKKTAASEPSLPNSTTSDWGTNTVVTQTVIAEQNIDKSKLENKTLPSLQPETQFAQNEKSQARPNSRAEASRQELPMTKELETGTSTRVEHNRAPAGLDPEENLGQAKAESRSNPGSRYTIKISAHANQFTAKKEVEFFRARGIDAYVTKFSNSNQVIPYWVCSGDFSTYDEARRQLDKMNAVIPGKRVVVERTNNQVIFDAGAPPAIPTNQKISTDQNHLIKPAKHTVIAQPSNDYGNQQNLTNAGDGTFTVRVSAHVSKFTAEKEVEYYRSKGYDTQITRLPNSSKDIPYSVCLGNFSSYDEAESKIKELMQTIPRRYEVTRLKQ